MNADFSATAAKLWYNTRRFKRSTLWSDQEQSDAPFCKMNSTHEELLFVSFCVEMYARRHEMSGEAVMRLFDGFGVCEFLVESYDPLHSLDREAVLDEIEVFMKGARGCESA